MKRYDLDLILGSMEEDREGEWVRYEDANAWWNEMKELPRVQDVATIYEMRQLLERCYQWLDDNEQTDDPYPDLAKWRRDHMEAE